MKISLLKKENFQNFHIQNIVMVFFLVLILFWLAELFATVDQLLAALADWFKQ
jgi:hypothetical protein